MKTSSTLAFPVMRVVSWVVFLGLCIKAGALLISALVSLLVNPWAAHDLYLGLDLSALHRVSLGGYVGVVGILIGVVAAEAYLAYVATRIFRLLNPQAPFEAGITHLITRISYVALGAGVAAKLAEGYCRWLQQAGVPTGLAWPGNELVLLAILIFVVAQVYQRGTALQAEQDLTI